MKRKENNKAKKWLIAGAIVIGISILLFVGLHVFTLWFQRKLETTVHEQSKGIYTLDLYGFETSPFVGAVSVDSLSLQPDYARWEELSSQGEEVPRSLLSFKSKAIELNRLSFYKMIFKRNVDLGSLRVEEPDLQVTATQKDTTSQHKPMHETASGLLKDLHIGKLRANKANFSYQEAIKDKQDVLALQNFDLTVEDFTLDSASFFNKEKAYYASNIELFAGSAYYNIPNDHYRLTTDSLSLSTREKTFSAYKINFKPTIGPSAMARAKGRATTYIKLDVPFAQITGVDYPEHSRSNNIFAQHILVSKPRLSAFKDKQHFSEGGSQPMPHDLARNAKGLFGIKTIEIRNGYGRYEELAPQANKTGLIYFSGFNSTMQNVTNVPGRMSRKNPAVVKARAMLMGKTPMQVTIRLPLLDKSGYHTLQGNIGSGGPQMLNPILVPTNFIKVDKGYVQSIRFDVTLNRRRATGTMRAIYKNLEIELLSTGAKSGKDQGFGKKILSKVADWFLIENSNPDKKGEKPRIARISVTRKKERSVITYWKDCIAMGLMSSMGLEKMAESKF
ncbi:MAG: CCDC28 family protein [Pontibacter sp.]|nr:CCDC28 family protein [Pontibacter sp.]